MPDHCSSSSQLSRAVSVVAVPPVIVNRVDSMVARFQRCEASIVPLSRHEARDRLQARAEPMFDIQRRSSVPLNHPHIQSVMTMEDMEKKLIALDYRLQLDQCLANMKATKV